VSDVPANLRYARDVGSGRPTARRTSVPLAGEAVGTAGILEATYLVPTGADLLVERIFIRSTSTNPTTLSVYVGDVTPENLRSYSDEGDLNEAEFDPPLWIPAGAVLRLRWEGGSVGFTAQANVQGWLTPAGG
jgi:hypothetical protein